MSRKRTVSRTFVTTTAHATVLSKGTKDITDVPVTLNGRVTDPDKLDTLLSKHFKKNADYKYICVADKAPEYQETLYAMPEEDFLKIAKPVSKEEANDEEGGDN